MKISLVTLQNRRSTLSKSPLHAAFTLMEMMLVLAIIALLIAIGAVTLGEVDENAKFTAADAQMNTVKTAIQQYKTLNRSLPSKLEDLVTPPGNARVKRKLIEENGILDPWGTKFQYRTPGKNGKAYEIYSWGPDKKEGNDDVSAD
ncbi:general secretion pathway protein G [Prosthecobacter debontii]|uniref:General secretion pathway protein G n=1 Tax=Prosthecobacter debontii TaxID=48467 RepID=A0A1T4WX99_9BACT|nr:type II secretion system protein GspG [Prosthecobacter debontii]SKA81505.1 general secretion pathway protein G [Prosthecobacter debontii]